MTFLRKVCILLLLLPVSVFAQEEEVASEPEINDEYASELDMDELRRRIYNEAPNEIMSFSLRDAAVSLFLTGSWKGDLQFNPGFKISPQGSGYASSDTPIFMQEVDITLALWINNRWFVEANFLDDSSQNTYRAGYQGQPGEFLKYAGIGNTGLDFPAFAYMDLGGDSPSSFGFYSRFGTDAIDVHALLRYDSSSREERTFSGGRERTYSYVNPQNSVRGVSFVLPDTDIDSHITVYIEDERGAIRDTGGRRWRQALSTEYAASRAQGLLELSVRPGGMVAVIYSKNGERPWMNSMGSYDGLQNGFLTIAQNWFDPSRQTVKLENYPQAGNRDASASRPGEVIFNEGHALVIYESGTFSPFERRNRYDAPSSESEQAVFIRLSSGIEIGGYELVLVETGMDSADFLTFSTAASRRGIYELVKSGGVSRRDPQVLWPLAEEYPEVYLSSSGVFSGDAVLRFTNFSNTSGYFIGSDVVPGSVQVWRSGIQDSNFSYNSSSGEVLISGSVGQNELIRITYLKRSEETKFGSIAAGLGLIYNNSKSFTASGAIGVRMNLSDDSYTGDDYTSKGNAALSAKAAWDYNSLKAYITGGFALELTDATGLYRAAGMEGHEIIISLPHENSFLSNPPSSAGLPGLTAVNRSDLTYRNYFNNNILGSNLMQVDWNAPAVSGINRPYAAKDLQLGNAQVLIAEFNLNSAEWTGFQTPLGSGSDILSRAGEIEIPFRFYDFNINSPENFKVVLQIGALSGKDFAYAENPSLVWEKILFKDGMTVTDPDSFYSSTVFDHNAKIARFKLTDEDRKKLGDAKFLRLLVVYEGTNAGENLSGRVLLASPIVRGAAFRPVTYKDGIVIGNTDKVNAIETIDSGASLENAYPDIVNKFHKTHAQRILKIDWENTETGVSAGVDGHVGEMPLSDYREFSFFIKPGNEQILNNNETLRMIIASGTEAVNDNQLDAHIPMNVFREGEGHKVTIRYQGDNTGIRVNGAAIPAASFSYSPRRIFTGNSEKKTSYIAVLINPASSQTLAGGNVSIDEMIMEDPILNYRLNAGAGIEYKKNGALLSAKNIDVFSDLSVYTAMESEGRAGIDAHDSKLNGSVVSRTGMGISFFGIKFAGNMSFTAAKDTFLWSADHSISRTIRAFSIKNAFFASPDENYARHGINMAFQSNFHARFDADALYDLSKLKQNWKLDLGYTPKNIYVPSVALNTQAVWTTHNPIDEDESYGDIWLRSWKPLIPGAGHGAEARRSQAQIVITQRTKPVGAVITLDGSSHFSGAGGNTRLENTAFLDIPVVINKVNLNFRVGRGFKQQLDYKGENVFDDSRKYFDSVGDAFFFWKVVPIYSLFTPKFNDVMDSGIERSPSESILQYSSINDNFSVRINLPSVYNLVSFFVPSKILLRFDRVIEQKMDTRADVLNIGSSLGFSSINMFGAMGYKPIFKFYQSDEFSHAIDAGFIIPRGEDVSWRIQSVAGAGFRGRNGGSVNFENTLTLRNEARWLESFTAVWEAPTKKSLISLFYGWIARLIETQSSWLTLSNLINSNYEQLRRESLELLFDKSGDYLKWSLTAGHEGIVRILGRMNLSAFVKLKLGEDLYTDVFFLEALIGVSLRISF